MDIELRRIVGVSNYENKYFNILNEIDRNKMFFIVEKIKYSHSKDTYTIHDNTMYDLTTAVKKLLALDTLNEDRKRTSYHLQEVNFSMVENH